VCTQDKLPTFQVGVLQHGYTFLKVLSLISDPEVRARPKDADLSQQVFHSN